MYGTDPISSDAGSGSKISVMGYPLAGRDMCESRTALEQANQCERECARLVSAADDYKLCGKDT